MGKKEKVKRKSKTPFRQSMRWKMTLLMTFALLVSIFVVWSVNRLFLEKYYKRTKINTLESVYNRIDLLLNESELTEIDEDTEVKLSSIGSNQNVDIFIISLLGQNLDSEGFGMKEPGNPGNPGNPGDFGQQNNTENKKREEGNSFETDFQSYMASKDSALTENGTLDAEGSELTEDGTLDVGGSELAEDSTLDAGCSELTEDCTLDAGGSELTEDSTLNAGGSELTEDSILDAGDFAGETTGSNPKEEQEKTTESKLEENQEETTESKPGGEQGETAGNKPEGEQGENGPIKGKYIIYPTRYSLREYENIINSMRLYTFGVAGAKAIGIENIKTISTSDSYSIYSQKNIMYGSDYIDLYGKTSAGYTIFLRTNYASIEESATIANRFLLYVGIIIITLGSVGMYYLSRRFTKPILELSEISEKMSEMNFDVKYKVTTNDEIATLGQSMNRLAENLEKNIRELKMANNELALDNERKTAVDEMRKEFLSNVTHELKTPIALIQGYAEGLVDDVNDDPEGRKYYADVIVDEAKKMNVMVKKLLSLNQLEFGKAQIDLERFDIVAVIKSVLRASEIMISQKGIKVIFEEKNPIYVWADEYMMEEVITNYVSNAINHIDGKKIIEIKLIKYSEVLRVAVYNTGELIPEESLDKVWVKFYKVDKARTREYGGSGIGLSIVKAIMEAHNKKYGVANHENGVEFWFEIDYDPETAGGQKKIGEKSADETKKQKR
jgi:signal transduction histidine kinase